MTTPGSNLLRTALRSIKSQPVQYMRARDTRTLNDAGMYEPAFEPAVMVPLGSVQAVPRSVYEFQGLELSKRYVNWYVAKEVLGLERDSTGDQFTCAGKTYQITNTTDWFMQDGWVQALAVEIQPT